MVRAVDFVENTGYIRISFGIASTKNANSREVRAVAEEDISWRTGRAYYLLAWTAGPEGPAAIRLGSGHSGGYGVSANLRMTRFAFQDIVSDCRGLADNSGPTRLAQQNRQRSGCS